ncbi:hypothetical protein C4546_02275 [Candidatus Parcubacteria bacterium]|jgi:hypothetical protein|nr:MAG: hypothetical protein C4546_02275 [Candidatus Parcubacteria bacterium]
MDKTILLLEDDESIIRDNQKVRTPPDFCLRVMMTAELRNCGFLDIALTLQRKNALIAIIVGGFLSECRISAGPKIVRLLRERGITCPIIGCSGNSALENSFIENGADSFVLRGMVDGAAPLRKILELIQS